MTAPLLVVAGEASGDRAAAGVLRAMGGHPAYGVGGPALERAGLDLAADLRSFTALGAGEVMQRAVPLALAHLSLMRALERRTPRAALLVNFTEYNVRLARVLTRRRVPTLLYVAPQVWAWRPGRLRALRPWIDRLAVVLPFEESLWRRAGVDAHYVGHPALETKREDRVSSRKHLGLTPYAPAVAILPGSRSHEVRALLPVLLDAYEAVRSDRATLDARVLLAPSLDEATLEFARREARARAVPTFAVDPIAGAGPLLGAFDVSLCASGTASLEATLARAIPIVVYRVGLATEVVGRLLLDTKHLALPNILLGRRAFPELVQRDVKPVVVASALAEVLDRRAPLLGASAEVEQILGGASASSPSLRVARLLAPWLA